MDKNEMQIMVINNEKLFDVDKFQGFIGQDDFDYETRILDNYEWMRRGDAEVSETHKQPIGYSMIVNPELKKVYVYQRSTSDEKCNENRLYGKYSCGVGGHIDKNEEISENPILESMLREIKEEVDLIKRDFLTVRQEVSINPKVLGYVNSEKDEVSKVHFGILYVIETDATEVSPTDHEHAHGCLLPFNELENIISNPKNSVEEWTKIAIEPLRKYFEEKE